MKKDKKKNIQEDLGLQKIEVKFKSGKLFFGVNGREFFLDKETVISLFPREILLGLEATEKREDFSKFETVENLAFFQFQSKRGLRPQEIAKALGYDEGKYIKWLNENNKWINGFLRAHKGEIERKMVELEEKYPLPEAKKEEEFWPEASGRIGKKVAEMLLEDKSPRTIAQELKVDYSKFSRWLLNRDIQKNILRIRNELAEERRMKAERDAARNE